MSQPFLRTGALALALLVGPACSDPTARPVHIWGEDYIEKGIPARTETGEDGFVDGWSVSFDAFLVTVGGLEHAAGEDSGGDATAPRSQTFDLTAPSAGEGQRVTSTSAPARSFAYTVLPADDGAKNMNASAEDFAAARAAGASLWVRGSAMREDVVKRFTWAFTHHTRYAGCHGTADVGPDPRTTITIHADHLFYDDLVSEEPNLAFNLLAAADTDRDGEITEAELRALDIRTQERYQVGNTGVSNLWDFVSWQGGGVGHIDGEGHCGLVTRQP